MIKENNNKKDFRLLFRVFKRKNSFTNKNLPQTEIYILNLGFS